MSLMRPSVSGTVEKFQQALNYCYQNAIIHNQVVEMHLDIEKGNYTAYRIVRTEEGIKPKKILTADLPSNSKIINIFDLRGVKYETGIVKIPYTYTGVAEDYSIHFGDEYGIKKTLLVYRYNGKTVIKNGDVTRKVSLDGNQKMDSNTENDF
jgi:general secretion pathway protein H